jgi:hypothetical protein
MAKGNLSYATLAIYSELMSVEDVGALIGMPVSRSVQKGQVLALGRVAPKNACFFQTRSRRAADGLSKEIKRLVLKVRKSLMTLQEAEGVEVRFWVYVPCGEFNFSVFFDADVIDDLAAMRASITVDAYAG